MRKKPKNPKPQQAPNPNGANQFLLDPRQLTCWDAYINPKSETFGNATQSAIKAGYEPDYADQITTIDWFKGRLRRLNMLSKAEKVLDQTLDMEHEVPLIDKMSIGKNQVIHRQVMDQRTKKPVIAIDTGILKIKQDTAKFVSERLGKDEGYSTRNELTGNGGKDLIPDKQSKEKADDALNSFLDGQDTKNTERRKPKGTTSAV